MRKLRKPLAPSKVNFKKVLKHIIKNNEVSEKIKFIDWSKMSDKFITIL